MTDFLGARSWSDRGDSESFDLCNNRVSFPGRAGGWAFKGSSSGFRPRGKPGATQRKAGEEKKRPGVAFVQHGEEGAGKGRPVRAGKRGFPRQQGFRPVGDHRDGVGQGWLIGGC